MKHIIKQFFQKESNAYVQFLKYVICGGLATAVDIVLFYVLAWKVLPALGADDWFVRLLGLEVEAIGEAIRARRYLIIKVITFFFANLTAYLLNVLWVFQSGRHSRWKEFTLFYIVSIISWGLGTGLGWFLIRRFDLMTTLAYFINMVVSLMINYVCRKYLIFHG